MLKNKLVTIAILSVAMTAGGLCTQAGEAAEEYWMWGHHPDSFDVAAAKGENYNFPKGRRIDMADACRFLGVGKCCVVRWRGLPAYPYDDYARQFTNLDEIAWSIVDSGEESFAWKQDEALRLAGLHGNLTTFFLDDFFNGDWKKLPPDDLRAFKARARAVNPKSRLACVLYADENGINPDFKPSLDVCDVVSLWFWNGKSLATMRAKVEELRRLIGPEKKVLLGIYLWDFGGKKPLTREETAAQLATAEWLLDRGLVNGLIFHCTPLVDLNLDSVDCARNWIKERKRSRHPVVAGRDFHCFGTSLAPGGKYAPPKTNSFDGMSCEYRIYPQMSGDGRWVHDLSSLKPLKADDGTVRPFTINYYPRIPCRPNVFLTGKLDPRQDDYDRFKAREPNFVGFVTLEWVNDAVNPLGGGQNLVKNRRKQYSVTEAELAEVRARDEYVHCYDDRDQFTTNLLKKTFNRIVEVCQGDPKKLWIGEGSFCADHLCADWGAGGIAFETSRNYCFWQIQMMFARGAARQYDLPWYWYVASFFLGYNSDGKWSGQGNQCADTPDRGISRSAVRRVSYLSWLAGASCYQREGIEHAFYKPGTHELSEEGGIYDEFWNFTQTHRRGVPYQPVALLVPFNRGYTRAGGLAYKKFAYTHADKMLDVVMSTILEWPKNGDRAAARKGAERVLANSKYGDMFDVLVPNASRRSFFRLAIKNYPVAVLIGDYGDDTEMSDALREYVSGGGKLVVNSAQMTPSMSWARGKTPVRRVEKGTVIVTEEPYWCPWKDGEGPEAGVTIMGVTKSYPEVAKTFDDLLARLYPVRVTGEVQYGFNRLTDGWQIYLINNGGVTKFGDKAESFDSKDAEVMLDCSEFRNARIVELMTGRTLTPNKGIVRMTVPSGDLRIIDILQINQ